MIRLKIEEKNKNLYKLIDMTESVYELVLKFLDIDKLPSVGDIIYMNEQLLSLSYEGYSSFYTFGNLESVYGKANISLDDIDVIKLCLSEKTIYLKRLYG